MKVLVCGGREPSENMNRFVCRILYAFNGFYGIETVIHGGATGVDSYADNWTDIRLIRRLKFPADWDKHGKAAGPIRNLQMLKEGKPDLVISFSGGRGTANMVSLAHREGVKVIDLR